MQLLEQCILTNPYKFDWNLNAKHWVSSNTSINNIVNSAGRAGVCAVAVPQGVPGEVGPDSGQGAGQEQGAVHAAVPPPRGGRQEEEVGEQQRRRRVFLVRSEFRTEDHEHMNTNTTICLPSLPPPCLLHAGIVSLEKISSPNRPHAYQSVGE